MKISILTIFPEMFTGPFDDSMIGSAIEKGIMDVSVVNIRDFATDKHKTVDDYPFGGGSGMVMKPEPIFLAVESILGDRSRDSVSVILLSPQGRLFNQSMAMDLSERKELILICGHYKGVDERVRLHLADDEISIGDYVTTGGELAAMILVDAVTRLLPGVLGDFESARTDTFFTGLLGCAHFTKPRGFRGYKVPEVLLSGNHEAIRMWRRRDSLRKTFLRRPDLLESAHLVAEDLKILQELKARSESDYDKN